MMLLISHSACKTLASLQNFKIKPTKSFVDIKSDVCQTVGLVSARVEKTVWKEKNVSYKHILLFQQCLKASILKIFKAWDW